MVKAANKVIIDYNTYRNSKIAMEEKAIKSPIYEAARNRGVRPSVLKRMKKTELPQQMLQHTIEESKKTREYIRELFKAEGDTGYDIFNIAD